MTDPGRRPAAAQASARQRKAEESSESREEELTVIGAQAGGKGPVERLVQVPQPARGQLEQGARGLVRLGRSEGGEGTTSLVLLSSPRGGEKRSPISHGNFWPCGSRLLPCRCAPRSGVRHHLLCSPSSQSCRVLMAAGSCFTGQSRLLLCPLLCLADLRLPVLDWRAPNWTQYTPAGVSKQKLERGSLLARSPGGSGHRSHEDTLLCPLQPAVTQPFSNTLLSPPQRVCRLWLRGAGL